jgi:5-hydroxyisourate hydrolase-like protein (transthyretin family)
MNIRGTAPVKPIDGEQRFTIDRLLPGKLTIHAGKHVVRMDISESEPNQPVTIDLTQPVAQTPKRQVMLRFAAPDGSPPPRGTVNVETITENQDDREVLKKSIPLEDGVAKFDAYVSGHAFYSAKGMMGYWFDDRHITVDPGDGPLEIVVPVIPAGAVKGSVLNADGSPVTDNIQIHAKGSVNLAESSRSGDFANNINVNGSGKYFISSLPLDGDYTVYATHSHLIQFAGFHLDSAHPIADITLRLPVKTTVEGTIVDPEGRPLSNVDFGLVFNATPELNLASWGSNTNQEGRFHFTDLSAKVGQYSLAFAPKSSYRPLRVALPLDGKPVVVKMQRGLVLEGQALDAATGLPVPGVEVWALPAECKIGDQGCNAEGVTDQEGRFRFSNFEDRPYHLNVRNCVLEQLTPAQPQPDIRGGDKNVVIKVTLPEWCKLKPRQSDSK